MRKYPDSSILMLFIAVVIVWSGFQTAGYAKPIPTNWTIIGPSSEGGNSFVGNGNAGPLSLSTSPSLSMNGGDLITLEVGGVSTGNGVDSIIITTSNNTIMNFGGIVGGV